MREARQLLGGEGPFSEVLDGFAPRAAQQALTETIEAAIEQEQNLVAEAGTGTGKTLAYLVPALASGKRVIISTGTKPLQDQLFFRDLPLVKQALENKADVALLKGRNNYLCLYRLEKTRLSGLLPEKESIAQVEAIRQFAARSEDGDLSTANLLPDRSPLWPRVTSTIDNCLGSDCPFYSDCYVVRARRLAQEADLVVVNHHLLFADMALKQSGFGELLPGSDLVILDEAHLVPDTATRFFSKTLSTRQIYDLLSDVTAEAAKSQGSLSVVRDAIADTRSRIVALIERAGHLPERGGWQRFIRARDMRELMDQAYETLEQLKAGLEKIQAASTALEACAARLGNILLLWQHLMNEDHEADVLWYERRGRGLQLHTTPLDVADPFTDYRASIGATWIFTSATLSVSGGFDHFIRSLGLDEADTYLADGVFDYPRNALMWLPEGLPEPRESHYTESVLTQVLPVIEANEGRAFLLFTSHRALQLASQWLRERCRLPLFVQGEGSRSRLLEQFRASGNGILLGAQSFWEGVDVIGDSLSLVVIDKLPFSAPDDPVLEARIRALKQQGVNAFAALQLPQAVIALKQGAGRLIRDVDDRGVLVLGDPRLTTKSYGKIFLKSLPPMAKTRSRDAAMEFLTNATTSA